MPKQLINYLLIAFIFITSPAFADVKHIDNEQTQALIDEGIPVIDVRLEKEWKETGVIEGSHLLTFFDEQGNYDAKAWLEEVDKIAGKDKPFMLICAVGGRTWTISQFLDKQLGYNEVHNVKGGIKGWIKQDLPVSDYPQTETK